jgi:GNAT superfamily N-acetyltransferase
MRIRKGQLKDAKHILYLLRTSSELQGMDREIEEPLYSEEFVKDHILDKRMNLVLVVEDKGRILGFILAEMWLKKKYSFLSDMAIIKEARGKGIGKELYKYYEAYCKSKGIKNIVGLVQVKNKGMQEFCKKVGLVKGHELYYYEKAI